jgi:actin-related protein 9
MAQLGCSELTPPTHRIPTRMFQDGNEWRPYYTFKRTKKVNGIEQEEWVEDVDEDKGAVWPIEGTTFHASLMLANRRRINCFAHLGRDAA